MTNFTMTCNTFDDRLPDYIEGTLTGETHAQVEQHLRECVRCAGLVRDLENIQKEASALPDLVPSRDLWSGIESRISAPVIPLTTPREKSRRFAPAWMAVAAAALVASTAAVTYTLAERSFDSRSSAVVAQGGAFSSAETVRRPSDVASNAPAESQNPSTPKAGPGASRAANFAETSNDARRNAVPAIAVSQTNQPDPSRSDTVYGKEIAMLQAIVSQRKTQLDSSTIAVIERNLEIIDAAIAQSRAALARDPASMLLSQQLSHALDKKVELLRTAAMLPANT